MENKNNISTLKRFFKLLQVDKQDILSIYVYALFNGVVVLSLPLGIQAIISLISGGQVSTSWIILVILVIVGVGLSGVMQIMQLTIAENIQQKIFTRSAFEFAFRIPRMKLEALGKAYLPEQANRFFDTIIIQKGLSKILLDFSSSSMQVVFGLILLSLYHPFFIFFSIFLILIVYLIFRFTAPYGLKTSLVESSKKYEVVHWLEEVARAMGTFKLAGKSPLPLSKTDDLVVDYIDARKSHFKTLLVQYICLVGFKVIIAAGLLLIGGLLVINQQMNIGQFVASEIIIILVLASVEKLILSMETIYDVLTSVEKIGSVTDIPLESDNGTKVDLSNCEGLSIHLNNLSYRFLGAQKDILNSVQLQVGSGKKVCLSGSEGSGKSLLLQMIAGLYNEFSGTISYNDVPLANWSKEDLRILIGDNLANEEVFRGTLLENITLSRPYISLKEVQDAVLVTGLTKFVESLPDGFETELLPEGRGLAKSTRLKIMMARSIIGNPKVILLEDNFNYLNDLDKERFLDYVLNGKWTVIAVSNNPLVAKKFDEVNILSNGEIIASGPLESMQGEKWYSNVFQVK